MTKKKWQDPLDKLLEADTKISSIDDYLNKPKKEDCDLIYNINPKKIRRWVGKDRPANELGDLNELADSMKLAGQQVPCIVREIKSAKHSFELIVGERRWRAALLANIELKVIISNIDDRNASLIQAIENEQRNNLSDYAIGMSYSNKIKSGLLTQKDLIEKLCKSKQEISRLLSFSRMPLSIIDSIGDFRKVSARTAAEISRLAKKSKDYENIIISFSDRIRDGKLGHSGILKLINKKLSKEESYTEKVYNESYKHILTWKNDNNAKSNLFSGEVAKKINKEDFKKIIDEVIKCIDK